MFECSCGESCSSTSYRTHWWNLSLHWFSLFKGNSVSCIRKQSSLEEYLKLALSTCVRKLGVVELIWTIRIILATYENQARSHFISCGWTTCIYTLYILHVITLGVDCLYSYSSHFRRKNQPKVWSHCCIVKLLMDNVNSCMKRNQNYISVGNIYCGD